MTHEELDRLWFQAMEESIKDGEMVARYHFAALVAAAELRRLHAQRDALLEALREIVAAADGTGWDQLDASFSKARAAIKQAEEKT